MYDTDIWFTLHLNLMINLFILKDKLFVIIYFCVKIVYSEQYAAIKMKRLVSSTNFDDVSRSKRLHPFFAEHLELFNYPYVNSKLISLSKATSGHYFASTKDCLLNHTLSVKDEALYVDYKSRAFMLDSASSSSKRLKLMSRLWAGLGSFSSGYWDLLYDSAAMDRNRNKCLQKTSNYVRSILSSGQTSGDNGTSITLLENMKV